MRARAAALLTLVGTLAIGLLFVLGDGAAAKDSGDFLPAFRIAYPDAAGTRIDNCSLCHFTNAEGKWDENQFADAFDEADKDFAAIENLDSDGDGFSNLVEIQAKTFPGENADNPATVVTTTTIAATPGSGEAIYQANCAGCHGGGGGNLLGRGLTLGQLTTAVADGVTGMPGYTGTLTSSEIILVSQYVLDADGAPITTTTTAPGTPPPPPPNGSDLYASRCSSCHGNNGGDLVASTLSHSQLVSATAGGTGGGMPAFSSSLTSSEIEAIINYIESIAPPTTTTTAAGTPPPPPPNGATVYANNCAACHGAAGGDLVGRGLTKSQVSAVTNSGTTGMPGYSTRLSAAEIEAVSGYVAGLSGATPTTTTTAPGSPPPNGATVWAESCAVCHGASGGDLVDHSLSDAQLRSATANGQGTMPGFSGRLSSEQINAVVAYLSALRGDSSTSADSGGVDGSSLYGKYCSSCHGADGTGGAGGPVAGTSLTRSELISITADGRDSMPSYSGRMTGDEIAAVADFILGLSGESQSASVTPSAVDSPGGHLYASLCAACHGSIGEGGIGGAIVGEDLDAEEVREVLLEGDDGMPSFPDLSEEELDSLVEHTLLLADGALTLTDLSSDEAEASDDVDESDEDEDNQGLSMFLSDEGGNEEGRSPLIIISMLTVLVAITATIGVLWLKSVKALAE